MYGRIVKIRHKGREFIYLRLLEKIKENGRWKERVVANLGRQDIKGREALGELLKSGLSSPFGTIFGGEVKKSGTGAFREKSS